MRDEKRSCKDSAEILKAFGGKENVISATHCATRLRVEVKDASIIDEEGMKEIQGVARLFLKEWPASGDSWNWICE